LTIIKLPFVGSTKANPLAGFVRSLTVFRTCTVAAVDDNFEGTIPKLESHLYQFPANGFAMKSFFQMTTCWLLFISPAIGQSADNFPTLRSLLTSSQKQAVAPASDFRTHCGASKSQAGQIKLVQLESEIASELEGNIRDSFATVQENPATPQPSPHRAVTWARKPIMELRMDIRELHSVSPADRANELNYGMGDWTQFYATPKVFAWAAPDIRYQPLYFEDVALERYGQTLDGDTLACNARPWRDLQPWRSGYHFFKSAALLPHQMWHQPPKSCDYPLGFYRPGSCTPPTRSIQFYGLR